MQAMRTMLGRCWKWQRGRLRRRRSTKALEEEARKMIAAAKERAAEEAMAMERETMKMMTKTIKSDAAATRHDGWMWTTVSAAAAVKHDERTRTTSTTAAEEEHDEKESTAAAATMDKQDEKTNVAAVEKWDEEMNMNVVGHREAPEAINLLSFRTDAAVNATEKRMNLGGSLEFMVKPESSQRRMIIETRPVRELNTLKREMGETTEGDQTDGWTERELRGDWGHLHGPEYCSVCGQNPFECGCLNVSFESRRGKLWREERERERDTGKMVGTDQADTLRVMREETAELSLRVEKLERAALWEGSGGSSGSGGNGWVWWNGTWWIRTKSRMNSASKRKVSRAVKQAMRQDDEKLNPDLKRMMAYLKHEMSDTDHETTRRRNSNEQANNVNANENRMCVSPGLDLLDLHSIPDLGHMRSIRGIP